LAGIGGFLVWRQSSRKIAQENAIGRCTTMTPETMTPRQREVGHGPPQCDAARRPIHALGKQLCRSAFGTRNRDHGKALSRLV